MFPPEPSGTVHTALGPTATGYTSPTPTAANEAPRAAQPGHISNNSCVWADKEGVLWALDINDATAERITVAPPRPQ